MDKIIVTIIGILIVLALCRLLIAKDSPSIVNSTKGLFERQIEEMSD